MAQFCANSLVLSPKAQDGSLRIGRHGKDKRPSCASYLRWHHAPWACLTFDVQRPPDFFVGAHAELMGWKQTTRMSSATAFIFRGWNYLRPPGRCPDVVPIASIRLTRRLLASIRVFSGQSLPSSFDIRAS